MDFITRALGSALEARAAAGTSKMNSGWWPSLSFSGDKIIKPLHHKEALTFSAVYNAVDMISDSLGVVPFFVFDKTTEGRQRNDGHAVDFMLNQEPDGEKGYLSPFKFKKLVATSVKLRGNCLFYIQSKNNGALALSYIDWSDVQDIRTHDEYGLSYHIRGQQPLFAHEVLHFTGFSLDGVVGIGAIAYAAVSMGMAIELQKFSYAQSEAKGVRQGVLESDHKLDSAAKLKIAGGVRAALGERSADRFMVLDEGMKYKPITVTPQEAQLVEQGRFTIEDMARWFNIPLYKIKSLTQSTNNNVEQMAIDYTLDTVQPIVVLMEQELQRKLLTRKERLQGRYVKGNIAGLIRGDMRAKGEFYSKMVQGGIMTPNEIRAFEELNAQEGGDKLRFPVNTQTEEQIQNSLKDGQN